MKTDQFARSLSPSSEGKRLQMKPVAGIHFTGVRLLMLMHFFFLSLIRFRNPFRAIEMVRLALEKQQLYHGVHPKMIRHRGRYYLDLNTPAWPSVAFSRYLHHVLDGFDDKAAPSLHSGILAFTNRCGFQCEHCLEWNRLNSGDELSVDQWEKILARFHETGICQLQLSGGEPLNRWKDLLQILSGKPADVDYWIYSNGYAMHPEKATMLKQRGLTGVIISLDHFDSAAHDRFRGVTGAFERALQASATCRQQGLLVAFSCCATNSFISSENLIQYARLCKEAGAAFIQFMEPEPVGRYQSKQVVLLPDRVRILQLVADLINNDPAFADYPIITHPHRYKREAECPGAGLHYLYVNPKGKVQACPFCQRPLFDAVADDWTEKIKILRAGGCASLFSRELRSQEMTPTITSTIFSHAVPQATGPV